MVIYLRAKGRTSPPAKIIGHRESINLTLAVLKLVAITRYLATNLRTAKVGLIDSRWPIVLAGGLVLPLARKYIAIIKLHK